MIIQETLERSYSKFPSKTALVIDGKRYSYRELFNDSKNLSENLVELGLEKEERVCILLENSYETVVSIYGTLMAGLIFIPVNPDTKKKKFGVILENSDSRLIITDKKRCNQVEDVIDDQLMILVGDDSGVDRHHISFDSTLEQKPVSLHKRIIDSDIASIIYTSGTTGVPKGVTMTHLNMITAMRSIIKYLENSPEDVIINVLPISFDYGLYQVLMVIMFGGTLVLEKNFIFFSNVIKRIKEERVTGFPVVPAIAEILLSRVNGNSNDLASLRYITSTAQRLPSKTIKSLRSSFPDVKIYSMYGLTECKRISYLDPKLIDIKPDSVGKAMPNTEVFLIDEDGKRIDIPDRKGELVVRGSNVMKGYWKNEVETNNVLREGYYPFEKVLLTGDFFKMDSEGFLYFISRKDDVFKVGGEKVSPTEVEDIIIQLEGVNGAVLLKKEDRILGHSMSVVVSVEKGISEETIKKHCVSNLERHLVPHEIILVDSLPVNENSKIDRKKVSELYIDNK